MSLQKNGNKLFLVLALALSSCRTDQPPAKEICILDGHGGGDCVEADGRRIYRLPSEMINYWSTNEPDMQNFSAWCYGTDPATAASAMKAVYHEATR